MEENKTELEKRWELEEENSVDEIDETDAENGLDTSNFINHPLVDQGFMPIVMVTCGPRVIIGGLVEANESVCILKYPMSYIEMLSGNGIADPNAQIRLMVRNIYLTLGMLDDIQLRHDSLYLLRNSSMNDMKAAKSYENALKESLFAESGLVPASTNDLANIRPIR